MFSVIQLYSFAVLPAGRQVCGYAFEKVRGTGCEGRELFISWFVGRREPYLYSHIPISLPSNKGNKNFNRLFNRKSYF